MKNVLEISEEQFATEVLQSGPPVLVDFYAPWCGPCKMIAPVLDDLAGQLAGRAKIVKVNVDEAMDLAGRYSVSSVPTLMIFHQGQPVETMVGLRSAAALKSRLEGLAGKPGPAMG